MQVPLQCGIWDGDPSDPHGFVLAPYSFELTQTERDQLNSFSTHLYKCLAGVAKLVAIGEQAELGSGTAFEPMSQALRRDTNYQLPTSFPARLPYLCKVDVVKTAQGFQVVEIDATNPRSWGYSIMGRQLAQTINPGALLLPGVVEALSKFSILKRTGAVTFLYGDTQRFYNREFRVFASAMKDAGVDVHVVNEREVVIRNNQLATTHGESLPHTLVDLPAMNRNPALIDWLKQATIDDQVRYLVPPQYFLAAKNTMGLLSNAVLDPRVEALLNCLVNPASLAALREFLPETWMVDKTFPDDWADTICEKPQNWALKRSVSSGAKGVWLGDDEGFEEAFRVARKQPGSHILQAMAEPLQHSISYYDPDGSLQQADDWQLRLTLYCSPRRVEDIAITARRSRLVHGATDAILAGTVLV